MMADEVDVESEALHQLPVSKLHERFVSVYGEAPRSRNRVWLIRKILWRLQSLKGGSLSERARQRATELAADADVRLMPAQRSQAVSVKPAEKRPRTATNSPPPPPVTTTQLPPATTTAAATTQAPITSTYSSSSTSSSTSSTSSTSTSTTSSSTTTSSTTSSTTTVPPSTTTPGGFTPPEL